MDMKMDLLEYIFASHHLIIDAVSWRILLEDIKAIYNNESLLSKTTSYRQWINVVNSYADNYPEEKSYWLDVLQGQKNYNSQLSVGEQTSKIQLSKSLTKQLINQANKAYNTEINDLLLTALAYALNDWSESKTNHIVLGGSRKRTYKRRC